jgi:hypothetical protein
MAQFGMAKHHNSGAEQLILRPKSRQPAAPGSGRTGMMSVRLLRGAQAIQSAVDAWQ